MHLQTSRRALLQEMFREMVLKKNIALVAHYYHRDFVLESNGQRHNYSQFLKGHQALYATDIHYAVRYDEHFWVQCTNSLAVRMWISTRRPEANELAF